MNNYLVTGGLGFIGSHLVEKLLTDPLNRVWVVDDGSNATWNPRKGRLDYDAHIRDLLVQLMGPYEVDHDSRNPKLVIISGDCAHTNILDKIRAGHFRTVFHLASDVSVTKSIEEPMVTLERNVVKTLKIAKACAAGKTRIVFSSSAAVYGNKVVPLLKEDMVKEPVNPYGMSKLTCENWLEVYSKLYNLDYIVLRYFNVFGPRQQGGSPYGGVIGNWMQAMHFQKPLIVYGDGNQTRDFVFVEDIVEANVRASQTKNPTFTSYNVCNETSYSLNDILEHLVDNANVPIEVVYEDARQGEVKACTGSSARICTDLGWNTTHTLWDGLVKTMAWRGV